MSDDLLSVKHEMGVPHMKKYLRDHSGQVPAVIYCQSFERVAHQPKGNLRQ